MTERRLVSFALTSLSMFRPGWSTKTSQSKAMGASLELCFPSSG